jgi:serine/threonine protein kinase
VPRRYPFYFPCNDTAALVQTVKMMLYHMRNQRYALPAELNLSAAGKDLLVKLLHPDPKLRIDMEGILNHPWFQVGLPEDALKMNRRCVGSKGRAGETQVQFLVVSLSVLT